MVENSIRVVIVNVLPFLRVQPLAECKHPYPITVYHPDDGLSLLPVPFAAERLHSRMDSREAQTCMCNKEILTLWSVRLGVPTRICSTTFPETGLTLADATFLVHHYLEPRKLHFYLTKYDLTVDGNPCEQFRRLLLYASSSEASASDEPLSPSQRDESLAAAPTQLYFIPDELLETDPDAVQPFSPGDSSPDDSPGKRHRLA